MSGPICIVTPTGTKICEADSYEGKGLSRKGAKMRIPRNFTSRVVRLMELAHIDDAPFCIVSKKKVRRSKK